MVTLTGAGRVMDLREGEPARLEGLRVWRHVGRETGAQAVSLRVLEASAGAATPALINGDCEEVAYVLEGRGTACVDGWAYALEPGTGLFVPPRAQVALVAGPEGPLTMVSAQCPDPGPSLRLTPPLGSPAGATARGAVARLWDREARPIGDRWYRVLIDGTLGCEEVTQFVGAIPPGRAPDHFHEYEEVLCFLAGEGRLWAGEASAPIAPGMCAFLPRAARPSAMLPSAGRARAGRGRGPAAPTPSPARWW